MELRWYQKKGIELIYLAWSRKEIPLLHGFTGFGKTVLYAHIIYQCMNVYKIIFVVRTRKLVLQTSELLLKLKINHGVYMSGSPYFDKENPIQICSIDTIRARGDYPHMDNKKVILIIDEADESKSNTYQNFIDSYPQALLLGGTATPYNFLSHFNKLIQPIKPSELRDQGYLVPFKIFAPVLIDIKNIPIEKGEFKNSDVYDFARKITGDIIETWKKHGKNRRTLCFATNVKHSKEITEKFLLAGISAAHIDASTSEDIREYHIDQFKKGLIKVLCNVRLVTRGVDIPEIGCIIDAAPTAKLNLFIQKLGRGSRKNDLYSDCIVIDNAGNCLFHGDPYFDHAVSFDSPAKRLDRKKQILPFPAK